MSKIAGELYKERLQRIEEAIQLKKPDRVPILLEFGYFIAKYSNITYHDTLYDYNTYIKAYKKTVIDLEPDAFNCLPFDSGEVMEAVDTRVPKWAGHGLSANQGHQYVEGEYMLADEYDPFLENPTDFILQTYLPRTCGNFMPLKWAPGLFN
jgi:hypothetical protein